MSEPDLYVATDVEADGPIPGDYSMLSLGMAVVGRPELWFYTEMMLIRDAPTAAQAMKAAADWVNGLRAVGDLRVGWTQSSQPKN